MAISPAQGIAADKCRDVLGLLVALLADVQILVGPNAEDSRGQQPSEDDGVFQRRAGQIPLP
jgi:hypothetical protein